MGVQAAVHGDDLAADIGALVGAEIDAGVADVFRAAVPVDHDVAQENVLQHLLFEKYHCFPQITIDIPASSW